MAVAAGYMHTCAVVAPGEVCCWGYNKYGQLGTGDKESYRYPTFITGLWHGDCVLLLMFDLTLSRDIQLSKNS